jgi:hypothetical protein
LRERLIASLRTDQFGSVYEAWIEAGIARERLSHDLQQERDAFIRALSATSKVEISASRFYDIIHDVEVFRLHPERRQARAVIKQGKELTEKVMCGFLHLHEVLQAVERPHAWGNREEDAEEALERFRIVHALQYILGKYVLGRALMERQSDGEPSEQLSKTYAHVGRRLNRYLRGWDKRFALENATSPDERLGNTPNVAVHDLVHRLSEIYAAAGGKPSASWDYDRGRPGGPYSRFLTLIYAALPHSVRYQAADNPSGFVARADEVLSDRKRGRGPSRVDLMEPTTDATHRALLAHRDNLLRERDH